VRAPHWPAPAPSAPPLHRTGSVPRRLPRSIAPVVCPVGSPSPSQWGGGRGVGPFTQVCPGSAAAGTLLHEHHRRRHHHQLVHAGLTARNAKVAGTNPIPGQTLRVDPGSRSTPLHVCTRAGHKVSTPVHHGTSWDNPSGILFWRSRRRGSRKRGRISLRCRLPDRHGARGFTRSPHEHATAVLTGALPRLILTLPTIISADDHPHSDFEQRAQTTLSRARR